MPHNLLIVCTFLEPYVKSSFNLPVIPIELEIID